MEMILMLPLLFIGAVGLLLLLIATQIVIRDQWNKWRFFRKQSQAAPRQGEKP